jgi:hypothetical protein
MATGATRRQYAGLRRNAAVAGIPQACCRYHYGALGMTILGVNLHFYWDFLMLNIC